MLKSIDLFAGIGGIRLGFDRAFGDDIKTVFVSEWDECARATYRANFHDDFEIAGDITKISEDDIPDFDICLAGFPCQAFSLAGQRKGFQDDYKGMARGTLFFEVARICEKKQPKVIFCENVKGLTLHDRGRTFAVIKSTLEKINYKVFSFVCNSKDFGVAQNRERIYIIAFRNDIAPEKFDPPAASGEKKCIEDILEPAPIPAKYYLSDVYLETLRRHRAHHEALGHGFGYEIRDLKDIAGALVCGGMGRERNLIIDHREHETRPTTHIKGAINEDDIRKMTPREWARLQGFPDSFQLPLADVHIYKQLGNSVTVPVIQAIAEKIKEVFMGKTEQVSMFGQPNRQTEIVSTDAPSPNSIAGKQLNKGEWSEVYAFLKLLADGRLYGADGDLNKKEDIFYEILQIIRNEQGGKLHFVFDGSAHTVTVQNDAGAIKISVGCDRFRAQAENLYGKIVGARGTAAFSVMETSEFMEEIGCKKLKASSADKKDITINVHDFNTGLNPTLGFSIKSRLGKPATLLNAGANTNFIFEIQGGMTDADMGIINSLFIQTVKGGKPKSDISVERRISYILNRGLSLKYATMAGATFLNNLILIDSDLPAITGYMLLEYYLHSTNNILEALNAVSAANPLGYDLSQGHQFYHYKFKKLLTESALGMLPGKVWSGKADANGGYIVVREDGEVLCYHLYNRNDFEDYLLKNTRFDRGGAGRHGYAVVEKRDGKYYIKLNLQIRFIR